MKQIILIMAHKNREQIERLVNYFEGKCDIIIHLDKKGVSQKRTKQCYRSCLESKKYSAR